MVRFLRMESGFIHRKLAFVVCFVFCTLFASAGISQTRIGDWQFRSDGDGTAFKRRFALTPAPPYSGGGPTALLVIRRMNPDSRIEMLVTATFDKDKDGCDYDHWEVTVDSYKFSVSGFSVAPSTAILKVLDTVEREAFWESFKKGLKLAIRVEQKCGGSFRDKKLIIRTFSLRGSTAAYNFVSGNVD